VRDATVASTEIIRSFPSSMLVQKLFISAGSTGVSQWQCMCFSPGSTSKKKPRKKGTDEK
jgi:hypothetical protein